MMKERIVRSACRMCHGVCGVFIHMEGDRVVKITGDPDSPTSRGYLCPKGAASPELLYHPDRILYPLKRIGERGENKWKCITWDEALDEFAGKLDAIRKESGPEYLGMVQGTGRPYTELNLHFTNAFGTPNFTWPTHICYFNRRIACILTMGDMPIADVYGHGGEMARCTVIWGCNVTHTGASDGMCGGMVQGAINGAEKVIVIDPRRIAPARKADQWLQLRPGTDGALALAMLNVVINEDLFDHEFVEKYSVGFDKLTDHVRHFSPEWAAPITGLNPDQIRAVSRVYATTKPATIQWGNGLDMNKSTFQLARAIAILMGITGNIDRPGGNWLQVRPQINNLLKGPYAPLKNLHLRLDANKFKINAGIHPPAFWRSIVAGAPYRLRALWIVGSNPLLNCTHSLEVEKALRLMEFTVVSDFFLTPTAQFADIVLPAATWLEQDKVSKMCTIWAALARKKVAQMGEVRDDNEVFIQMGRRLGLTAEFPWKNLREYHDWLLEDTGMDFDGFCEKGILAGNQQYYKYRAQGFETPSKKFEIFCGALEKMGLSPLPVYREPPMTPISSPEVAKEYPLTLTTGCKIKPFFHSEFRQIESLRRQNPDPLVEIHPVTAESIGVKDGDWVWIETRQSRVKMRAKFFDGIARDVVCAQYSWWFPEAPPPEYGWKQSSVNLLIGGTEYDDSLYDPDTGAESMKCWLCKIYPVEPQSRP